MSKKKCDTPKCEKCGGRTATVSGMLYYQADTEPYLNGKKEHCEASGDVHISAFCCDECNNLQGITIE